jgi:hypothetical protein
MLPSFPTIIQPQSIDKTTFLYLKDKRLRHVNQISLDNLDLSHDLKRFFVWFTLHSDPSQRAFYVSDRKENDKTPKWQIKKLQQKLCVTALKKFTVRIWLLDLNRPAKGESLSLRYDAHRLQVHCIRPCFLTRLTICITL